MLKRHPLGSLEMCLPTSACLLVTNVDQSDEQGRIPYDLL